MTKKLGFFGEVVAYWLLGVVLLLGVTVTMDYALIKRGQTTIPLLVALFVLTVLFLHDRHFPRRWFLRFHFLVLIAIIAYVTLANHGVIAFLW